MMLIIPRPPLVVVASLLVLAASVLSGEASAAAPGEVLTLDADNFTGAIQKHAFIAVEFFAPVGSLVAHRCFLFSFFCFFFCGTSFFSSFAPPSTHLTELRIHATISPSSLASQFH